MAIGDIFDVQPFNVEVALELSMLILPPERERFFMIARSQPCNPLEVPTFDGAKEQVGIDPFPLVVLPILLKFVLIFIGGGPDSVLDGLMDIVVVSASNNQAVARLGDSEVLESERDEVGECFDDLVERGVVFCFDVFREVVVPVGDGLLEVGLVYLHGVVDNITKEGYIPI